MTSCKLNAIIYCKYVVLVLAFSFHVKYPLKSVMKSIYIPRIGFSKLDLCCLLSSSQAAVGILVSDFLNSACIPLIMIFFLHASNV